MASLLRIARQSELAHEGQKLVKVRASQTSRLSSPAPSCCCPSPPTPSVPPIVG